MIVIAGFMTKEKRPSHYFPGSPLAGLCYLHHLLNGSNINVVFLAGDKCPFQVRVGDTQPQASGWGPPGVAVVLTLPVWPERLVATDSLHMNRFTVHVDGLDTDHFHLGSCDCVVHLISLV